MATRETHKPASEAVQPTASLESKLAEIDLWGSEVPIVAKKSGNADGAKGHQFKQDDAGRHAPDPEPGTRMPPRPVSSNTEGKVQPKGTIHFPGGDTVPNRWIASQSTAPSGQQGPGR